MSKPSLPPNAIDLPIAPWITPCPACTRNCTPISTAKSRFEKTENRPLKKFAERLERRGARHRRRAAPRRRPTATATTAQPFVVVSGPRHTASTADARQDQQHDGHARDQRDPVGRRSDAEPVRREPAGHDQQQAEQRDHEQVLREVVQRAGMDLELLRLRRRRGLRVGDDVRRRGPQAVALDDVDVGADLDALAPWPRPGPAAVGCRVAAVLDPVAQTAVVLADQEHHRVLGELLEPRLEVLGLSCRRGRRSPRDRRRSRTSATIDVSS